LRSRTVPSPEDIPKKKCEKSDEGVREKEDIESENKVENEGEVEKEWEIIQGDWSDDEVVVENQRE
jgi:hypothetical protein